jgi:hypothetical protein
MVPIARALDQVRAWWRPRAVAAYSSVVLGSTAVVGLVATELVKYPRGLPGHSTKIAIVTALATFVAALAAAGVACVACGAEQIQQDLAASPSVSTADWERQTEMYLQMRAALDSLLACTAAIIGAAIISTGALRDATIAWQHALNPADTAETIFPQEQVLAYGVFYSAVLALLYLPVYERRDARASDRRPSCRQERRSRSCAKAGCGYR